MTHITKSQATPRGWERITDNKTHLRTRQYRYKWYDNDNDNDNDNEIIFIAKWHTDHVQRTWVKNRSGRNNIHEIYKTWQRGLEAIVAYVPQYQLYQADCLGSAEQKQCRVLELFQYKTRSFMRMYTHIYASYGKHVHIHVHVYTSIHRESIITIDASMY